MDIMPSCQSDASPAGSRRRPSRLPGLALLALTAALVLPQPGLAAQHATVVHEHDLDNGMRVLVRPDPRAAVAVIQLWFPVGSSHERFAPSGVSHALEHMMFKGTETHPTGSFQTLIRREGGRLNAFTGFDYTAYHEQISADRLALVLELEADRLANIRFEQDEFALEMEVIREERRQVVDNNPFRLAQERFHALAWQSHPYRNPIIGWASDLDAMTLDDLRDWYHAWYGVNQAILVVVGDVEPEQVFALAQRWFGDLEPRPAPAIRDLVEDPSVGERRVVVHDARTTPFVLMGWRVPSLASADDRADSHALSLLVRILDGGRSARLPRRLIRGEQLAASAWASYSPAQRLDTLLYLSARPAEGVDVDTVETALRAQITDIIEHGVSMEEVERARIQARAEQIYRLDSLFAQGMEIGLLETTGIGWRAMDEFIEAIEAIGPDAVQAVARRYLQDRRLTVMHVIAEPPAAGPAADSADADPTPDSGASS
jgi:zinc protease